MLPFHDLQHPRDHVRVLCGEILLNTRNPALHYRMEASPEGFHQLALSATASDTIVVRSAPIDIVIGSGRKGQTYLYWEGERLFQLPVSYWTGIGWANSPGYPSGTAIFNRPADPRCLECLTHCTARWDADGACFAIYCNADGVVWARHLRRAAACQQGEG